MPSTRQPLAVAVDRPHVDAPTSLPRGERLHHRLRTVEVPVLAAPRGARQVVDTQPRHELGRLRGRDEPRRDTLLVLQPDIRFESLERRLAVRSKEISAAAERQRDARRKAAVGLPPERDGLDCEAAGDACAPLLPDTARLHSGGAGANTGAVDDDDLDAARPQVACDREAHDPGTDDDAAHARSMAEAASRDKGNCCLDLKDS